MLRRAKTSANTNRMASKVEIQAIVRSAFDGVTLDGGVSFERTRVLDNYGDVSSKEFNAMPQNEIIDDWASIDVSTLDEFETIAHLDSKGFRYYIPALMLRLLDNYDSGSMMTIATLHSLYPKEPSRELRYSQLNESQLRTIAEYMKALPALVDLNGENQMIVERAYRNYWSKYLDT